ncbi:monovalent cation/H+ antiporter subunit D family protein [Ferrimonas balearica]|uniref:monovalent cation/H+ antiporter subunit D family protein n=1 Tax=Ferrimonas balearica TaxID=44012 RepID=UPI001C99F175|nr:monovalent cation/H+ antiporter subunit D family protein [Ferrimonas balearica]MBY5920773.1 monovalent cation/H+ antiporter subunit D family protein [Ferrimonas balearica]MBY5996542.1 monovalent cation/H+ antiporter subunit D family protein [Ferrimonas balearica]
MMSHLPILPVILPLLAAPSCLLLGRSRLIAGFVLGVCMAALGLSVALWQQVMQTGVWNYPLGGWEAPWGIEYRIDALGAMMLVLVSGMAVAVMLAAPSSIQKELAEERQLPFYVLFLLVFAGSMGIVATGDAFNLFVFLEISSLSTYALIALGRDRRALWAAYQYLILGTLGATFILIGVGLLYMMTGTLNMADLAQRLPAVESTRTIYTAFAFVLVGVCLKLALFPLHLWLPGAYACAPSVVSAFLAATSTKVAVYVLLRFVFTIFGGGFSFAHLPLEAILLVLGVVGVVAASVAAIYQKSVKRLFAYSSVAQVGYLILGIAAANRTGLLATLLHLINHALMKGALFLALAAVCYQLGHTRLHQFAGLGRRMPWTMAALVIGGLSLVGVPGTVGFVSKWYLVLALLERDWWPIAMVVLMGSVLALVYLWKVVEVAYFVRNDELACEAPLALLLPTWILVIANLYLGLDTRWTLAAAQGAVNALLGGGP